MGHDGSIIGKPSQNKTTGIKMLSQSAVDMSAQMRSVFVVKYLRWCDHAGHTRKASRISKTVVENCGKGVGNFYLS